MSKFIRLQATATRLIVANGNKYSCQRITDTTHDPVEGTVLGTTQTQDIWLATLSKFPKKFMGESGIVLQSENYNCLISASNLEFPLEPGVKVNHLGNWRILKEVTPIKPDGVTTIFYKAYMEMV